MSERVNLLNKDCLPPHDERPDDHEHFSPHGSRPVPTWLFVIGIVALVAYLVFALFQSVN